LRIYNLGRLRIYGFINGRVLVRILVYGGITVRNLGYGGIAVRSLGIGYTLASKINSNATWVCRTNLVKWVSYKARDFVKFKGGKEVVGFDII